MNHYKCDLGYWLLKMRCQIYISMKKMIILRKIQVKMRTFAPPFFDRFCLSLNRKKLAVMRDMTKKLDILTLQLPIYYILYQNRKSRLAQMPTLQKAKQEKQIVFVAEKQMQCLLLRLKSRSTREASRHLAFIGNYPTISHMRQPYLPSR